MAELTDKHANVNVRLKNLLGSKKLEWHMKSLRMSGQHEVLLRFQRNQTKALKADLDDVLEQLGDQCEQNRKVKQELEDARLQLEASKGTQEEELRIQLEASKDSEARLRSQSLEKDLHLREVREQLDAAQKQIQTLGSVAGRRSRPRRSSGTAAANRAKLGRLRSTSRSSARPRGCGFRGGAYYC